MAGWSTAVRLPRVIRPGLLLIQFPVHLLEACPANQVYVRNGGDPASSALPACGARRVDPRGFRMLEGGGHLETPYAPMQFEAWGIEDRSKIDAQHAWRMGARQGAYANVSSTATPQAPPPNPRHAGVRGILAALHLPGKAGGSTWMNADARPGFPMIGNQSATLAFQGCDACRSLLVRSERQATRGHGTGKKEIARRAQMGFRLY